MKTRSLFTPPASLPPLSCSESNQNSPCHLGYPPSTVTRKRNRDACTPPQRAPISASSTVENAILLNSGTRLISSGVGLKLIGGRLDLGGIAKIKGSLDSKPAGPLTFTTLPGSNRPAIGLGPTPGKSGSYPHLPSWPSLGHLCRSRYT